MARIIHDDQGGQGSNSAEGHLTVIQAEGQSHIALPAGDFLSHGDILRDGQDLVLQASDGREVVIENYFGSETSPTLTTPHGSQLTPELVQSFVKSQTVELAANETGNDASGVGIIKEVSGDATVTRADGTSEKATLGMAVHQGDIIETTTDGAVNIVFLDESTFAISSNARMAIDEYVFDPATQAGETNVSILRGMFVFTSGLIGRDDPDDVQIDTPVGSIGIRGTTIAGHINPNGESQITVVEGAIVIKNGNTAVTLADQYETVKLTGFDAPIQMVGTLNSDQMKGDYGVIGTVAPAFMNTLNTAPEANEGEDAPTSEDAAPDAPADGEAPAGEEQGQAEAEQPVVASYDIFSDPLNSGFDLSVAAEPVNPFDTNTTVTASLLGASALPLSTTTIAIPAALAVNTGSANTTAVTAAAPNLLPLEVVVEIFVDDDALSGDVVGKVFTTINFPAIDIKFLNVPLDNGMPVFELVQVAPGVYNVVLTDAGEDAVTTLAGTTNTLGSVEVVATLPDGRTTNTSASSNYGDYSSTTPTTPTITPAATLALDGINAVDGHAHAGTTGQGLGMSAAYLGDFNRNGIADYAVTTGTGNVLMPTAANFTASAAEMRVAGGGDANGDGFLDFVVGTPFYNTNQGQIRIYNGSNPASATTNNGITGDLFGSSVAMVDFNGDGYADIFNGAKGFNGGEGQVSWFTGYGGMSWTGVGYTAFAAGTGGGTLDSFGLNMTSIRDYNNDGYGDVAIAGMNGTNTGYVNIYLGNNSGAAGTSYQILVNAVDGYDIPIHDMGDINGDGNSDIMIGETGFNGAAGRGLISFGGTSGAVGLEIVTAAGSQLIGGGSAGDFNGDGYDDIFVAVQTNNVVDAYVIYGSSGLGGTLTIDSTWLNANQGNYFHMTLNMNAHGNPAEPGMDGYSIGDQNGDGYEDLLITSPDINSGNGGYYVVYGRGDPFDLAGPDPEIHTDVTGVSPSNAGASMIASSNGDGLVGSAANNDMSNLNAGNIYSSISFQAGSGNDIIRLYGSGNSLARVIDGGNGMDSLALASTGNVDLRNVSEIAGIEEIAFEATGTQTLTIGLNDIFSLLQTTAEFMDAGTGAGSRYTLSFGDASGVGAKNLIIDNPNSGSTLTAAGFTVNGTYTDGGGNNYNVYTFGSGYQLLIDTDIAVTVQ